MHLHRAATKLFCTAMTATAIGCPVAASAQSQAGSEITSTNGLGEIVVTAQKRIENAQNIGVSITQISPDQLLSRHVQQPVDLTKMTPGLNVVNGFSDTAPVFAIRGIGLEDATVNNTSGVGVYVNDIYQSGPPFTTTPFLDVKRIEVLEGPQGTLYGRNTTGGAINVITNGPTKDLDGYANLGFGSWDTVTFEGAIGGPITDKLGIRIAAGVVEQGKGYQHDLNSDHRIGRTDHTTVRGTLAYEFDSGTKAVLSAYYFRDRSIPESPFTAANSEQQIDAADGVIPGVSDYFGYPIAGLISNSNSARYVHVGAIRPFIHTDVGGASLRLSHDFGFAELLSITAYDRNRTTGLDNADGTAIAESDTYRNYVAQQFSQELRLTSRHNRLVDWLVGATYGWERLHDLDGADASFSLLATDVYRQAELDTNYVQTGRSLGLYGNAQIHIARNLDLVTGLRFSHDRRSFDGDTVDRTGAIFGGAPGSKLAALDETHKSSNLTYKVGLNYKVTPKVLIYASVASGYKAGVYFGFPAIAQGVWGYVRPEKVTSFEAGVKSRLFDDHLQINLAGYHTDYKNRQTTATVDAGGVTTFTLGTIPKSRINGFEASADYKVVRGFTVNGSVSFIDAKTKSEVTTIRGLPVIVPVSPGTELPHAPRWAYNLGADYEAHFGDWIVAPSVSYHWSGRQLASLGDPNALYGPNQNLDASIKLGRDQSRWDVLLWSSNLTNNRAATYSYTNFLGERGFYRPRPVSFGATLQFKLK